MGLAAAPKVGVLEEERREKRGEEGEKRGGSRDGRVPGTYLVLGVWPAELTMKEPTSARLATGSPH